MTRAVHAQKNAAAQEKAALIYERLKVVKFGRAAEIVAAGVEETLMPVTQNPRAKPGRIGEFLT